MLDRETLELQEIDQLAPYALTSVGSKGRMHQESLDKLRTNFQRDRDRILHSKAFRRLKGKTQVMSPVDAPDHLRDRLTHTLEVAQLSRGLARNLNLNEDAAEAIALAHDLGHTPFGHAGEKTLNELMQEHGLSFEHNQQSKRVVTELESISPDFAGINLSYEILEGLEKHQTPFDQTAEVFVGASLEAQVVNFADEIAYTNHDVDDGLRLNVITVKELDELKLWQQAVREFTADYPKALPQKFPQKVISRMIKAMLQDLLQNSSQRIKAAGLESLADVYALVDQHLIAFSAGMRQEVNALRRFLYKHYYQSDRIAAANSDGQNVISDLFARYERDAQFTNREVDYRKIADFIAGMTDQFALAQVV